MQDSHVKYAVKYQQFKYFSEMMGSKILKSTSLWQEHQWQVCLYLPYSKLSLHSRKTKRTQPTKTGIRTSSYCDYSKNLEIFRIIGWLER